MLGERSQKRQKTEDRSCEVVFTCHYNVGQSPVEDQQIVRVVHGLHLSAMIF